MSQELNDRLSKIIEQLEDDIPFMYMYGAMLWEGKQRNPLLRDIRRRVWRIDHEVGRYITTKDYQLDKEKFIKAMGEITNERLNHLTDKYKRKHNIDF